MFTQYNNRFQSEMVTIYPGEYYSTSTQIIHTVLGTCIAVVLYSDYYKTGGMNHFMLSGVNKDVDLYHENAGRYGETAMELLFNDLMKKGIYKNRLIAKVFGGGKMIGDRKTYHKLEIGQRNQEFIVKYLEAEGISVVSQDTGGIGGRKILFFPWDGRVLVSRMKQPEMKEELKREEEYYKRITKRAHGKVFIFHE